MPIPRFRPVRHLLSTLLIALALLGGAGDALADHTMPNVVGQSERDAARQLEAMGLRVHVITLAGVPPERVAHQAPTPGTLVADGEEVELRVGVTLNIPTVAPRVTGMSESEAAAALQDAYVVEIEHIGGPRALEGRVLEQDPAPGATVPLRSLFRLRVVHTQVAVPVLIGRVQSEAERILQEAGLAVAVRYVRAQGATDGHVLGQVPMAGANILPGGTVEVLVAGRGPQDLGGQQRVRVPDLAGLNMYAAEEEIHAAGLTPHVHFVDAQGRPDWVVVGQEVLAGRLVQPGSHVGIDVVKPGHVVGTLRMPSFYGLQRDDALALLGHMGLRAAVSETESAQEVGTVIGQDPQPGAVLPPNATLRLTLAQAASSGWRPPVAAVPDVRGLTASQAYLRLRAAGFRPLLRREGAPGRPVDRVHRQDPRAGGRKAVGERVLYYVPLRASMPELAGKTLTQALQDLSAAGLQGRGERLGPGVNGGISEVVSQAYRAGTVLARGSEVTFRYRMKAPPTPLRTVPNVVGMSREAADQRLRAAGFQPHLRAVSIGTGDTRVLSQSPVAGARRPEGHRVEASYRFTGPVLPQLVAVKRVIGLSVVEAGNRLQQQGFRVRSERLGPGGPRNTPTDVVAQSPLPGTPLARGATVTITYRLRAIGPGRLVRVPDVTGKMLNQAVDALRRAGLAYSTSHIGIRVRSQSPAAGTLVAPGTSVKLKMRF